MPPLLSVPTKTDGVRDSMSHREIRIVLQAEDEVSINRGQELAVRTIFRRYFAKDGYRITFLLLASQALGAFAALLCGGSARTVIFTMFGIGIVQSILRGLALLVSRPPEPPCRGGSTPPSQG